MKIGDVVGRWEIIGFSLDGKRALCQCGCDDKTMRSVSLVSLKHGRSLSCGCRQRERMLADNPIRFRWIKDSDPAQTR
jgi:hypothetical protein